MIYVKKSAFGQIMFDSSQIATGLAKGRITAPQLPGGRLQEQGPGVAGVEVRTAHHPNLLLPRAARAAAAAATGSQVGCKTSLLTHRQGSAR